MIYIFRPLAGWPENSELGTRPWLCIFIGSVTGPGRSAARPGGLITESGGSAGHAAAAPRPVTGDDDGCGDGTKPP